MRNRFLPSILLFAVACAAAAGVLRSRFAMENAKRKAVNMAETIPMESLPLALTPEPGPKTHPFEQSLKLLCLYERDRSFAERGGAAFEQYYSSAEWNAVDPIARFEAEYQSLADCGMPLDELSAVKSANTLGLYPVGSDGSEGSIVYDAVIAATGRGDLFASCDAKTGKILRLFQRYGASAEQYEGHEAVARAFADYLGLGEIELLASGYPNVLDYYDYYCPAYDMVISITYSGLLDVEAYPMSVYVER